VTGEQIDRVREFAREETRTLKFGEAD